MIDRETAQIILHLLNPLHGSLDKQAYDIKLRENFNVPADAEYDVLVTAQQERDLEQAVLILESRLRDPVISLSEPTPDQREYLQVILDGAYHPDKPCPECGAPMGKHVVGGPGPFHPRAPLPPHQGGGAA